MNKVLVILLFSLLTVFVCAAQPSPASGHRSVSASKKLRGPSDAAPIVHRLEVCGHFSGEFNDDRSEHDNEVTVRMTGLRCEAIEDGVAAIRLKYPAHNAVTHALDSASNR